MSIKQSSFIGIILIGTLFSSSVINCAFAKDIAIYRWVDKNNIVHFSQNLPQGQDYTELSTVSSFKALSKGERELLASEEKAEQSIEDQEKRQDDITAKNKKTYEKNCKAAQLNIKMLNSIDEIHISEEKSDGTIGSRPLTTAEKEEKLALSKKHEALYCTE